MVQQSYIITSLNFPFLYFKVKADTERSQLRIDFAKYGPKVAGQKRVEEEGSSSKLPDDIYCDLVDSLKDVCLQSSLLEIWRYDR